MKELRLGLQITVAINAGQSFASRNTLGIARYEYIKEYLGQWATQQRNNTLDDLSLLTNSGIRQVNLDDVLSWQTAFAGYQPDLKTAKPSVDLLGQAVDIALGFDSPQRMEKAILYITPLPENPLGGVVQDVVNRANQANTRIYVWMLASRGSFTDPRAEELRQIATGTGGVFTAFSGEEAMTPISTLLEPLRMIYHLRYRSGIKDSGQHNLAGQVILSQQMVTTLPAPVQLSIQPPVPLFVAPPSQVIRTTTVKKGDQLSSLSPRSQLIEVMVQYPDGHSRGLVSTALMVDGVVVQTNTAPPFEYFSWDISDYVNGQSHTLQVEVTDELGLTSRSRELPVEIAIILPAINRWADFMDGGGIYLLLVALFAAGAGSAFLFVKWRQRRSEKQDKAAKVPGAGFPNKKAAQQHPVQPAEHHPGFKYRAAPMAEKAAVLALVSHDEQSAAAYDIPLGERKFTIGSDRFLADVYLNAEGVDTRHTLIRVTGDGRYQACNAIPGAVTLVNGIPVPEEGITLKEGDVLTIGQVQFCYREHPLHTSQKRN